MLSFIRVYVYMCIESLWKITLKTSKQVKIFTSGNHGGQRTGIRGVFTFQCLLNCVS